jgi:hypothetical protein
MATPDRISNDSRIRASAKSNKNLEVHIVQTLQTKKRFALSQ